MDSRWDRRIYYCAADRVNREGKTGNTTSTYPITRPTRALCLGRLGAPVNLGRQEAGLLPTQSTESMGSSVVPREERRIHRLPVLMAVIDKR